ncbi:MAG: enoyl-CoA hydratase-related protein [Aquamicrobium sp.]|uniref:enoyl-CoA hydratase/isomerase family protein n=1 Tax=Aquamicrobium sp. TaxID=1872579 RepID=UPI00349E6967|nr:enoyl-CoA hydratase-related protein [Aquamicrobium sp.]
MSDQLIIEWPEAGICVLRMNRPESYNALSRSLLAQMIEAVGSAPAHGARVLVLAANGPGFCSGADLKERRGLCEDEKYAHNRQINALANAIAQSPLCTIAAIGGLALGGGLEIALACDLRFAAAGVSIGLTETRLGIIPGAGGTQRLPRVIGASRALELMFAGEPIPAAKAGEWGLVNDVVAPERLMERVLDYARLVARRSPRTGAILKEVVRRGLESDLAGGLDIEREAIVDLLKSEDYAEGLAAFAEKRTPAFK